MIGSLCTSIRAKATLAGLFLLAALLCPAARGADKDKDKKPEKEKKEKIETWVEIRTEHFIVASDGGEKTARRIADEFESLLRVFQSTMPNCAGQHRHSRAHPRREEWADSFAHAWLPNFRTTSATTSLRG